MKKHTFSVEKIGGHFSVRENNRNGTSYTVGNGQFKSKPPALKMAKDLRRSVAFHSGINYVKKRK